MFKSQKSFVFHSPVHILGCAYTICLFGQISLSCTIPSGSSSRPIRIWSYTLSVLIYYIYLLYDWSFCLSYHIIYIYCFVATYLFLLWYDWFLKDCFALLWGYIQLFLKFPFLSHVYVFLCEMSLNSRLKHPCSCFSPIFFSLFPLSWFFVLLLVAIISHLPRFPMYFLL